VLLYRSIIALMTSLTLLACGSGDSASGEASPGDALAQETTLGTPQAEGDALSVPSTVDADLDGDLAEVEQAPCSTGPRWGADVPLLDVAAELPVYTWEGEPIDALGFTHGVASGDPLADRVILWTRFEAPTDGAPLDVYWEVATDTVFEARVAAGWTTTSVDRDYTVKVDASGLSSGSSYYYRFRALGHDSPIGRTRTAPEGCHERVRIAVASCANYGRGYFVPYRDIAKDADLDVVLHLGDYIYEYGGSGVRLMAPPWEIVTAADYRLRYAHYRTDPDLQEAHRQHPWIAVWDDHESANDSNATGAQNHNAGEGDWSERKVVAARVYAEWMPIREKADPIEIWRAFRFGDLIDLVMLETRLTARSPQGTWGDPSVFHDPDRVMLGAEQEAWLSDQLRDSTATWAFIGQQVMVGQLQSDGFALNPDQWDGYTVARERLFQAIEAGGADNTVVLTGDIHSSWGTDLARSPQDPATYDPTTGAGAFAVELVTPGVSSSVELSNDILEFVDWDTFAPHVQYRDIDHTGYLALDITRASTEAVWHHVDSVVDAEALSRPAKLMAVHHGVPHVIDVEAVRPPRTPAPPLAP
jgi:alkaline phosphatase D